MTSFFIKLFSRSSPLQVAAAELGEAELDLLKAESYVEYASSLVTYNHQRVCRLRAFIAQHDY